MSWRGVALGVASMVFCTAHVRAQEHPAVIEAQAAYYDSLDYLGAVDAARRALADVALSQRDRVLALELMAFSYASMDSTTQAIAAFRDLIFVDPEREPDPLIISPTITQLYVIARGQVLVVRRIEMDTTSYVVGQGNVRVRFNLSQLASVDIRVIGNGVDVRADSGTWVGEVVLLWSGLDENGDPFPSGTYDLQITARAGRDQSEGLLQFTIAHGAVDTVPHLDSLPGFTDLPEMVRPPRNWIPLAVSGVAVGITTGAVFAIQSDVPSGFTPYGLLTINVGVLATGLAASLRQPELEPVVANIEFNRLLRQQLAAENATRTSGNAALRRQVVLTITPVGQENR